MELEEPGYQAYAWSDVVVPTDPLVGWEFPYCQRISARIGQPVPDTADLYTECVGNKLNVVVVGRAKFPRTDHHFQNISPAQLSQDFFSHRETARTAHR